MCVYKVFSKGHRQGVRQYWETAQHVVGFDLQGIYWYKKNIEKHQSYVLKQFCTSHISVFGFSAVQREQRTFLWFDIRKLYVQKTVKWGAPVLGDTLVLCLPQCHLCVCTAERGPGCALILIILCLTSLLDISCSLEPHTVPILGLHLGFQTGSIMLPCLLSFSFICCFHSLTVRDRNSLSSTVKICSQIIGLKQTHLNSFFTIKSSRKQRASWPHRAMLLQVNSLCFHQRRCTLPACILPFKIIIPSAICFIHFSCSLA